MTPDGTIEGPGTCDVCEEDNDFLQVCHGSVVANAWICRNCFDRISATLPEEVTNHTRRAVAWAIHDYERFQHVTVELKGRAVFKMSLASLRDVNVIHGAPADFTIRLGQSFLE